MLTGKAKDDFRGIGIVENSTVTFKDATFGGGVMCRGTAKIILKGDNWLSGGIVTGEKENETLTIEGTGLLSVEGGIELYKKGNIIINSGTIYAYGERLGGAGIGGGFEEECSGNITITGGTVYAYGGLFGGAGIGSGKATVVREDSVDIVKKATCGKISINGGTVYAFGGDDAAGIGSGRTKADRAENGNYSRCGTITIGSATDAVYSQRGSEKAECIGKGDYGACDGVSIHTSLKDTTIEDVRVISSHDVVVASAENVSVYYDGKPHGIVVSVKQPASGTTIKYGVSPSNIDQSSLTFTNAGEYKIFYNVTAEGYKTFSGVATLEIWKASQKQPPVPTVKSVTSDSVTLNTIENGEYQYLVYKKYEDTWGNPVWGWRQGCAYQDSPTFTGLSEGTTYHFRQRLKENENYDASFGSGEIEVKAGVQGYNVIFNINGHGTKAPTPLYIEKGKTVTRPTDPVDEDGWTFGGWFNEGACLTEFDFNTPITADKTLYAKWTKEGYEEYDLWVGDTQVTTDNMTSIPCDSGTASYDPETNTLTFNDAKLIKFSCKYVDKTCAAVQSKGIPLQIKGKLDISDGNGGAPKQVYYGILILDSGTKATIDADITVKNVKSCGIWGMNSDIEISGCKIDVEDCESIGSEGDITLAEGVEVISPEGAVFRKLDGRTRLYKSSTSEEIVLGAVIGTTKSSYTVTFNMNGHGDAIEPVKVTEGNTVAAPTAPIAEGWIFGGWYTDEACTTAYDFTTPVTADITLYAKWTGVEYTVTFDMGGKATNIEQKVENGKTATRPENNPIAAGFKFMDWYKDAAFTTLFDFASVITGDTTIYAKWVENTVVTYTVTFDANGVEAVNMPAVQNVEEGGTATKPVTDPSAEGYKFEGWYKEAAGTNEFDFTKAIAENTVIFAKWSKIGTPDPEPGHSPLDPKPEIKEDTTQLWLVKGQKFTIGTDWKVVDDKISKKYVSISKKGQLKAKKADGGAEVKIKNSVTGKELTIHISKPEIDKKLTLTIVSANTVSSNKINLTKDEHLDVLYYSAAPDVAVVGQDGTVTAVAKGKAKITAYINGSAYNCTVTVKESVTPLERTIHLTKDSAKPVLKIQGVKKVDWKSASDDVAKVEKNKVKAGKAAGNTVLTASANGLEYKINVFVEDPAVSMSDAVGVSFETKSATKYEVVIPKGKEVTLSCASMDQPVVFKSTKPDIAFVDENGNVKARSKGKGKFTAKINGKTITITVKVTE